jgi:hypothetical protein
MAWSDTVIDFSITNTHPLQPYYFARRHDDCDVVIVPGG